MKRRGRSRIVSTQNFLQVLAKITYSGISITASLNRLRNFGDSSHHVAKLH